MQYIFTNCGTIIVQNHLSTVTSDTLSIWSGKCKYACKHEVIELIQLILWYSDVSA